MSAATITFEDLIELSLRCGATQITFFFKEDEAGAASTRLGGLSTTPLDEWSGDEAKAILAGLRRAFDLQGCWSCEAEAALDIGGKPLHFTAHSFYGFHGSRELSVGLDPLLNPLDAMPMDNACSDSQRREWIAGRRAAREAAGLAADTPLAAAADPAASRL